MRVRTHRDESANHSAAHGLRRRSLHPDPGRAGGHPPHPARRPRRPGVPAHGAGEDRRQPPLSPAARQTLAAGAAAVLGRLVSEAGQTDGAGHAGLAALPAPRPRGGDAGAAADRCLRELSLAGGEAAVGHHAGGLRPAPGGGAGMAGADLWSVWNRVCRTAGQRGKHLLGLPAVSAAPVSAVRRTPDGPTDGQTPGGLQRLSACPPSSVTPELALMSPTPLPPKCHRCRQRRRLTRPQRPDHDHGRIPSAANR